MKNQYRVIVELEAPPNDGVEQVAMAITHALHEELPDGIEISRIEIEKEAFPS